MSGFDPVGPGANPGEAANHSPVAQNQSGSLTNCGRWRVTSTGYQLPLSVEVCTPVSGTGRAGALPAAVANLISMKNKHLTRGAVAVCEFVMTDILNKTIVLVLN